jgi:hypothetical protein
LTTALLLLLLVEVDAAFGGERLKRAIMMNGEVLLLGI